MNSTPDIRYTIDTDNNLYFCGAFKSKHETEEGARKAAWELHEERTGVLPPPPFDKA